MRYHRAPMLRKHRHWIYCAAAVLGLSGAFLQPAGCILPDYCIRLNVLGDDYCASTGNAVMWPIGSPELATPVRKDGGAPVGCVCLNATEVQWLNAEVPEEQFLGLLNRIHYATRNACASLVPPGFDHDCYGDEIEFSSVFIEDGPTKSDSCFHSCSYFNPPPRGACPDDPTPFECNEFGVGDDEVGDTEMMETGDDTGAGGDTTAGFGEREVQGG